VFLSVFLSVFIPKSADIRSTPRRAGEEYFLTYTIVSASKVV
jgi:hypothetical protein